MFPSQVNVQPALGLAGDFADTNPLKSVDAGPGGFIAGPAGVTVGLFAWADALLQKVSNAGIGVPSGLVPRRCGEAMNNVFLAEGGTLIAAGTPVTLVAPGGRAFYVLNQGSAAVTVGMKAYADSNTGQVSFAATGTPPADGVMTTCTIAATNGTASTIAVNSVTGAINNGTVGQPGTTLTVSAIGTGALAPGQIIAGTNVDPGTTIVKQLTGTTGSTGTYQVSISQSVVSTTITTPFAATLTVGGTVTGYFAPGSVISGTNVTAGSTITSQISGTAGVAGTYAVTNSQTVSSTAIAGTGGLLTVGGVTSGVVGIDDVVTGSTTSAGTAVTAFLTGTGGTGTYLVNNSQTVTSFTATFNAAIETPWVATSFGAVGEYIKIA